MLKDYADCYVQNQGACKGHLKKAPKQGTNVEPKCWCCTYGCAVLCLLALKDLTPDEKNINNHVNDSADCTWKGYSKRTLKPSTFPCIGKLKGRQHFVIIHNEKYDVWDPSGGKQSSNQYSNSDFERFQEKD
ncbi:hypothetical protein K7432_009945 [Basidiobolus ranarum]|uniref:Uncharacterized protein n=1 Tax=Basidiobolus ranarum TaxID=34480 RepID=A0ABR2WPJ0_9FUNG